jgi:hypothetical protein
MITSILVVASIVIIFGFGPVTGRSLALHDKMTIATIGLGAIAGLLHVFGVVPGHRQLRAFTSPVVAWPVMLAGIATLLTS